MARAIKYAGWALLALFGILLAGFAWIYLVSGQAIGRLYPAAPERLVADPAVRADGERLAHILGCVSCHGPGMGGRMMFAQTGVATIWAPNVSALAGTLTDQQLARAIRQGIGHDGRGLWVMPAGSLARLSDAETDALVAFVRALPASGEATPPIDFGPLVRLGMMRGEVLPGPAKIAEYRARPPADLGPDHARGRRIAGIVCAACHGADGRGMQMEDGLVAPDLTLAAAYAPDDFVRLIREGVGAGGRDLGLMSAVARDDLSHLTDTEIAALHAYLIALAGQ